MKIDGKNIVLASGRRFYAYAGVLGLLDTEGLLDMEGDQLVYGYDGHVVETGESPLTPAERAEIAEFMIDRWTSWRNFQSPAHPLKKP